MYSNPVIRSLLAPIGLDIDHAEDLTGTRETSIAAILVQLGGLLIVLLDHRAGAVVITRLVAPELDVLLACHLKELERPGLALLDLAVPVLEDGPVAHARTGSLASTQLAW